MLSLCDIYNIDIAEAFGISEEAKKKVKDTSEILEYAGENKSNAYMSAIEAVQKEELFQRMRSESEAIFSECDDEYLKALLLEAFSELPRWEKIYITVQVYERAFPYIGAYRSFAKEKMNNAPEHPRAMITTKKPSPKEG